MDNTYDIARLEKECKTARAIQLYRNNVSIEDIYQRTGIGIRELENHLTREYKEERRLNRKRQQNGKWRELMREWDKVHAWYVWFTEKRLSQPKG